ncbi:MAG: DUF1223 domain-containing protein [Alphaproteobacteria bacterium]|nr:DUF1223 domain-containing protein [Alphaproteobacteria bacterium]
MRCPTRPARLRARARAGAAALLLLAAPLLASGPGAPQAAAGQPRAAPVVVELFTSQGCSSCPPADAYLAETLAHRADVIALSYHVDYWDYIGWEDPFADPAFTARQRAYGAALGERYVYTPQMVVDGRRHAVGSRRGAVEAAIAAARADRAAAAPSLTLERRPDGALSVRVDGAEGPSSARVLLVSFDRAHETAVGRGENGGRRLVNARVVRALEPLGVWTGGAWAGRAPAERLVGDGGAAVLLQQGEAGPILAAAMIRF